MTKLSIIIPTLNEAGNIKQTLQSLQYLRKKGHEIILVDGGSTDHTTDISLPFIDKLLQSEAGRAKQMNNGAKLANGDILLFLHADTQLPKKTDDLIFSLEKSDLFWGYFKLRFTNNTPLLRLVSACMNIRTTITGIITGDHALFINRGLFEQIDGFPEILLMEDITISRTLLRYCTPIKITSPLTTSSRRWEKQGIIKTILFMWWLRLLYFFGVDPNRLARHYYPDHFTDPACVNNSRLTKPDP